MSARRTSHAATLLVIAGGSLAVFRLRGFNDGMFIGYAHDTIYDGSRLVIVGVLVLSAVGLWLGSARARAAAYGVAVACSVQLVGTGIVAVKHWAPYYGAGGGIPADINTLKAEAIILSVAGAAGVVVGIDGLRHGGGFSSDAGVQRYLLAGVGLTTVLMLPWLLGRGSPYTTDATSLGGYAAMASVPCGVAIALAGWTAPVVSRAILVTVTISSVACWMSASPMNFEFSHPDVPFALTAVVTLVLQLLVPCRRQ